jgi:hypothetical protein
MSTRKKSKSKSKKPPKSNSGIHISLTPPISHESATMKALTYKSYKPLVTKETKKQQLDLQSRIQNNKLISAEDDGINATWKNVTPLKRVKTVKNDLNNLKGGRKRNSTKKKRRNKTKKKAIKNQRK